jgi:hypothetical protein
VHFEETAKYFRHAEVTGVPVRQAFFEIPVKHGGVPDPAGVWREPGGACDQRGDDPLFAGVAAAGSGDSHHSSDGRA